MKWVKRLLLLVVFLAVLAGALAGVGWWLSRGTPDWYTRGRSNPREMAAAAHRAEQQVNRTLSWAADQQAHADSVRAGLPASTQPAHTFEISLTQDELNGFFQKWDSTFGWATRYDSYLSDPQIIVRDGQLILAATVRDMGSVVSIEFSPQLEDGKLKMPVERVLAGRLPLPQTFWEKYRVMLESKIGQKLPAWKAGAQIRSDGTANGDTVAVAMSELLLDSLQDRPAPAVLFLPYDVRSSHRSLPVKLTQLKILDNTLTLSLEPMPPAERQALLDSIRRSDNDRLAARESGTAAAE
jgi:uncharacterized protein YpmS